MKILFFSLLFISQLVAQVHQKGIFVEPHSFVKDDTLFCNISFALTYAELIFQKEGDEYQSRVRISVEASSIKDDFIKREIYERTIITKDYALTNSDATYEDIVSVSVKDTAVKFQVLISDIGTNRKIRNVVFVQRKSDLINSIFRDIFIFHHSKSFNTVQAASYQLVNRDGVIPFSSSTYYIAFQVNQGREHSGEFFLIQDSDTVKIIPDERLNGMIRLYSENNTITAKIDSSLPGTVILFKNDTFALTEGPYNIVYKPEADSIESPVFTKPVINVKWLKRPLVLYNTDISYNLLTINDPKLDWKQLLKQNQTDPMRGLLNYWKKFDPTPETEFNEVMEEFYRRADVANEKYSTLKGTPGSLTDRGKVLIKYGQPNSITRKATDDGKIAEIWKYIKPGRYFYFVDSDGTGNFKRKEAL